MKFVTGWQKCYFVPTTEKTLAEGSHYRLEKPTSHNRVQTCCRKLQESYQGQFYYGWVMDLPPGFQRKLGTCSSMRINIMIIG